MTCSRDIGINNPPCSSTHSEMVDNREKLKAELKASPSFKAELKDRLKAALQLKVPESKPIQYNFDS